MNLSDLLPPELVREIARQAWETYHKAEGGAVHTALAIAAPEIARAVLEMAAKALEDSVKSGLSTCDPETLRCAALIRHLAKEFTDA